jgi:hypothetical protein
VLNSLEIWTNLCVKFLQNFDGQVGLDTLDLEWPKQKFAGRLTYLLDDDLPHAEHTCVHLNILIDTYLAIKFKIEAVSLFCFENLASFILMVQFLEEISQAESRREEF